MRIAAILAILGSTLVSVNAQPQSSAVQKRRPCFGDPAPAAPATIDVMNWLVGDWVGTVAANTVEERWMAPAGGAMIGNSRTTRGPSMVEFEFLCIAQRAGGLVYTAMPNGGGMTDFLSTKVSADSITFENPSHDFPKAIVYTKRADGGVDVAVTGAPGQRVLNYSFKKKQ